MTKKQNVAGSQQNEDETVYILFGGAIIIIIAVLIVFAIPQLITILYRVMVAEIFGGAVMAGIVSPSIEYGDALLVWICYLVVRAVMEVISVTKLFS